MDATTVSCAFTECTAEVYLPHTCSQCSKKFCDKHKSQEDHKCPFENVSKLRTTVCPLCNEVLRVEAGESLDHAVNTHLDTGKCQSNGGSYNKQHQNPAASLLFGFSSSSDSSSNNQQQQQQKNNFCSMQSCNHYEPVPIVCSHCKKNFCLKHKLPEQHDCSKLANVSKTAAAAQQRQQQAALRNNNNNGTILEGKVDNNNNNAEARKRKMEEIIFTVSNTAETAVGIRKDRGITEGDILVLMLYDAGRLKRPNLKPVLFSVSALTPIGRLLDSAIDHYPALPKTARYNIFSSVALQQNNNTKRHQIVNQNMHLGDAFAEAAATGTAFPIGSMDKFYSPVDNRVILAFCISIDENKSSSNNNSNEGMMVRSDTDKVLMSSLQQPACDTNDVPLETHACWVKPFKDAKGVVLPILVDKHKVAAGSSGSGINNNKSSSSSNAKKDDKCLIQ